MLEGGFDAEGTFVSVPFAGLQAMTEAFRRRVITLLVDKQLLSEVFGENLLSWRHSGFSIDNSVRANDVRTQESLAQYISRPPASLKKIRYEPFKGRVLFHTTYSDYFKENVHMFDALDFLADLTQHVPPRRVQLIRRYGLYASRTKGCWSRMPHVAARKRAWARLLAKVYEIDALVCPKCGCEMTVVAVIQDPVEIRDILAHLVKTGRAPPGFDPALLK